MIITKIRRVRGRKPRYMIEFDSAPPIDASDWTIGRFGLCTGDEINSAKYLQIQNAEAETNAKNCAINFLSYRLRSRKEVEVHLQKKGFAEQIAYQAAEKLEAMGMINDREFTRMFIRDRLQRNKSGSSLVRQQLSQKGISKTLLDTLCAELITQEQQQSAALESAKRYVRRSKVSSVRNHSSVDERQKQKRRLFDFLVRRGFSLDIARNTVDTVISEDGL